ncbi:hypothetical protein Gogos_005908, partial [Gossypium gossypioides]|nr:hypothetical protein [Gossypium gossypioides]
FLNIELIIEKRFLDKVEDNAAVRIWSEKTQQEKGDSLTEGYMLELWDFTRISVTQDNLQELKEIWDEWDDETNITGMSKQWVAAQIKQKGDSKYIPWKSLRDLILAHPDTKKRVDVFALSIYGSISACRRAGEGRFFECAQLLLAWFHSHFWKVEKVSYQVFSKNYSPMKEFVATPKRDNISEEKWTAILQSLQDKDIELRAPWMFPIEILYRCGDFDWYWSRKFILATQGLAHCEFAYKGDNYKKKVHKISNAWNQTHKMKIFATNPMNTPKYDWWWGKRVNDNVSSSSQESTQPIEEHLQVVLPKLEIKLKAKKMRKGKNKAEEDLDSLKTYYKKLHLSLRTAGLEDALERDLLESRNEKVGLRAQVAELDRSLHQYRSRSSAIELKASINKIEELKGKIEELEAALQNCILRVKLLETKNEHWKEQFQRSQCQIRDKDHIMGEVVTQVREVADHLQTLEEQLAKVQQDMRDQIQESQRSMISQLTQLLAGGIEKGKSTVINSENDNEDPTYPLSFTPVNAQAQLDTYPRRVPVSIRPQQYQAGTSTPVNYPTASGSNLGDNSTNPVVSDLDDIAEMDRARIELPKQLEDRCKWLEEKFKAMEEVN